MFLSTSGNNPETSLPTVIEAITRLIASFRGSRYCELRSARSSLSSWGLSGLVEGARERARERDVVGVEERGEEREGGLTHSLLVHVVLSYFLLPY